MEIVGSTSWVSVIMRLAILTVFQPWSGKRVGMTAEQILELQGTRFATRSKGHRY